MDMQTTNISNQQKYENYREQFKRLNRALASGFNLEAMENWLLLPAAERNYWLQKLTSPRHQRQEIKSRTLCSEERNYMNEVYQVKRDELIASRKYWWMRLSSASSGWNASPIWFLYLTPTI